MPSKLRHNSAARLPLHQLLVVGILLAFFGQLILLRTTLGAPQAGGMQAFASILLLLGATSFGLGARQARYRPARLDFDGNRPSQSRSPWYRPLWKVILPAILGLSAIGLFAQSGESPIVLTLWLAGVLALLIGQLWGKKLGWRLRPGNDWPTLVALLSVLALALALRTYKLADLPYNFDGDFASFGLEARALISGVQPHIFRFGWAAIPTPGYLPAAITMRLFGDNIIGLRASGVAFGLLSIAGVYWLGRDLFRPRVGLIAAALLAGSYAHLAGSREAQYLDPVPLVILCSYLLLLGLRERRGWAIAGSGFALAFCVETYYSGRLAVPIVAMLLLHLLLFHRPMLKDRKGFLLLWLGAILVALGPMLVVFTRDVQGLLVRSRDVFILNPVVVKHMMGVYKVDTIPAMMLEQARRSALMFHFYPDADTQFAIRRPLLDPITAPLGTLGLGLALFRARRLGHWLLLSWIFLGILLGAFLTVNPPFWTRLMVLLPAAALLAALSLDQLFEELLVRPSKVRAARRHAVLVLALATLLVWIGVRNWKTYVELKGTFANGPTRFARYMAGLPSSARAYLVSTVGWNSRLREFEFLIPDRIVADLPPDQALAPVDQVGSPTLIVLTAEQNELVRQLQERYPEAELTIGPDNAPDSVAFYALETR